jgi:hypothetical protein
MALSAFPLSPVAPVAAGGARVDKRELRRQYKEAAPPMGVYVVRNTVNQRVFVGASANPEGAMNRMRFELGMKSHRNAGLMRDWIEFGTANFSFEVIDTLKKSDDPAFDAKAELAALLQLWRNELGADGAHGYSVGEGA